MANIMPNGYKEASMEQLAQEIDAYFRGEIWAKDVFTVALCAAELLSRLQGTK